MRHCLFLFDIQNEKQLWTTGLVDGIAHILQRDYWHRIWVVQEIALAKSISIICGRKSVQFDDFDKTFCAIQYSTHRGLFHFHQEYKDFNWVIGGNGYRIKPLNIRLQGCLGQTIYIQKIMSVTGVGTGRPCYTASDPRDLAFILVGVLTEEGKGMISVDYKMTMEKVFTMLTRTMLCEPLISFVLNWCVPQEKGLSMPSWHIRIPALPRSDFWKTIGWDLATNRSESETS